MKMLLNSLVFVLLLAGSCSPADTKLPCTRVLRGKLVGQHPLCAGAVIQVISGSYDRDRVDVEWRDALYDPTSSYTNVFTVFSCDVENELPEVTDTNTETEFNFVFTDAAGEAGTGECITCDPLVALPLTRNRIKVVGECDHVGEE